MPGVAEQPATLARLRRSDPIELRVLILGGVRRRLTQLRLPSYLAIALGVQSIAPFLLVGLRSVLAGDELARIFAQLRKSRTPTGARGQRQTKQRL